MRKFLFYISMCFAVLTLGSFASNASACLGSDQLPQDHWYQVKLRDYLRSFQASDFVVQSSASLVDRLDKKNIQPNDNSFMYQPKAMALDEKFRAWVGFDLSKARHFKGIYDLTPAQFTLNSIESKEGVRLKVQKDVYPASLLFLFRWDFKGNPFYENIAILNRALVVSIVDMICLDDVHRSLGKESARVRRSDFLGGSLGWYALSYAFAKDRFPEDVRDSYEHLLEIFVSRLLNWGPRGALGNMDSLGLVGLAYIYNHVDDQNTADLAKQAAENIIKKIVSPAGYVIDGGGTDVSYGGLALYHIAWAAKASEWEFLHDAVRRILLFKNVLTLPDPDGNLWGPSHFSVRTSADAANDQWRFRHREIGLALGWPELAGYLIESKKVQFPDREAIGKKINNKVNRTNREMDEMRNAASRSSHLWAERHFDIRYNWAWEFVKKDDYQLIENAIENRADWLDVPMIRHAAWDENLNDEVVLRKRPGYAAIVHGGRVGKWGERLFGLGGGGLSAFWTPDGGSIVLGRRRGYQHENRDRWDEWREWPVHAISGTNARVQPFSSARWRFPSTSVTEKGKDLIVSIKGQIGDKLTAPNKSLKGPIYYEKTFYLGESNVRYELSAEGEGVDEAFELVETLPLFIGDERRQPDLGIEISFIVDGSEIAGSTQSTVVQGVYVRRFEGGMRILFQSPQLVSLAPSIWKDTYQSKVQLRNLLIDLNYGRTQGEPVDVAYTLEPLVSK